MKTRRVNLFWRIAGILLIVGLVWMGLPAQRDTGAQQRVAATRQTLRQQGFKTDLADFDFSTSPEMRSRENALTAAGPQYRSGSFRDRRNLMEIVDNNAAVIVWKENTVKNISPSQPDNSDALTWDDFRQSLDGNRKSLDAACDAIMSGPIRFDLPAGEGSFMRLPHLALLRNLIQSLTDRTVLALHDGDKDAAWTNLLAATRLVTVWEPEPAEISHVIRFVDTRLIFNATWQAFQTNHWPDDRLARLQAEWEAVNFFTNLPEIMAFNRASQAAACENRPREMEESRLPLGEFIHETWSNPLMFWRRFRYRWSQNAYLNGGIYDVENGLLLFYRDREIEFRNAVQTPTWMQMRPLPGVTNTILFQSKYHSPATAIMRLRDTGVAFQRQGMSLLGRAAEAEAERRIIITAIALERYHAKHGAYPQMLAGLVPEFMKSVPIDFMDGRPLRYQLTKDGHFILYSVGQDCVDNGGKILDREERFGGLRQFRSTGITPEEDIVWPVPAAMAAVSARRQEQLTTLKNKIDEMEEYETAVQWKNMSRRQAGAEKLLANTTWTNTPDPVYHGHPLSEALRNKNVSGTDRLSFSQMLTLKQIITGAEPETITFEVPVSYDAVTSLGTLNLVVDPVNIGDSDDGALAGQWECERADNGNCRLVWSTIYESPGKHALEADFTLHDQSPDNWDNGGPLLPVVVSNLCQFSLTSDHFDYRLGVTFRLKLTESNGTCTAEMLATNGTVFKTVTGNTSNGIMNVHWDLVDDHGNRFTNDSFNSVFHITLPDSARSQTLRGP